MWGECERLYRVFVLHRQYPFKALPPKVLIIVNVYTGNVVAEQCTQDTKYVEIKYTIVSRKYTPPPLLQP